jgi:hypothetical protein
MKNYTDLISRLDFHAKAQFYWLSRSFYNSWKCDFTTTSLRATVFLAKPDFMRFRFPAFPVEMVRLETQACTRKALDLLGKTCATPFPVSKTRFHEKPLFIKDFRFPVIIYKYIYEGRNLHIYLICKNLPRKFSRSKVILTKIIKIILPPIPSINMLGSPIHYHITNQLMEESSCLI